MLERGAGGRGEFATVGDNDGGGRGVGSGGGAGGRGVSVAAVGDSGGDKGVPQRG